MGTLQALEERDEIIALDAAVQMGEGMLVCGGEVSRVENTISRHIITARIKVELSVMFINGLINFVPPVYTKKTLRHRSYHRCFYL